MWRGPKPVSSIEEIKERAKFDTKTGCYVWTGACFTDGYPKVSIRGKRYRVNRVVLSMKLGRPLTDEEVAAHECDRPICVNDDHIFLTDAFGNNLDKIIKGRQSYGTDCGSAKLQEAEVLSIRRLHDEEDLGCTRLAQMFKMSEACIGRILRRETWRHL